jgi:hypothetical protein
MYYLAASSVCLAALVGSFIYENHRLKKEQAQIREAFQRLEHDIEEPL